MNLKFFSMFSGIGAPEKALENLGIDYELVGYSEIDKYASRSYSAIHGVPESKNLGDITKVDAKELPKDIDLVVYGFPCQDISNAGQMKGLFNEDGTKTRSGLFFEALRIIEETQPKIAIAENVKNLTSKRFKNQFKIVLDSLEEAGYHNYWKVLNAKDFGVPQNRERVFIVSIRKDIDTGFFQFPEGFPLEKRLKDILEDEVDEKYYLSEKVVNFITQPIRLNKYTNIDPEYAMCHTTRYPNAWNGTYVSEPLVKQIGNCCPTKTRDNPNQGRVYDSDGLSPSLNCMEGGNRQPFVMVKEATKKGYAEAIEGDSVNLEQPNSKTRRGRVGKGVAQTLTTSCNQAVAVAMRGRRDDDGVLHQVIEMSDREYANSITTVQKDSMVGLVGTESKNGFKLPGAYGRKYGSKGKLQQLDGLCDTLQAAMGAGGGNVPLVEQNKFIKNKDVDFDTYRQMALDCGCELPCAVDEQNVKIRDDGTVGTITTDGSSPKHNNRVLQEDLRLRKLTPKECFRLMGFDDESFHRAEAVNSNSQLYKQAGNSIVVNVLEYIFKALYEI